LSGRNGWLGGKILETDTIKIRPLKMEDFEIVLNWSKNIDFCIANGWEINRNEKELYEWWGHCVLNTSADYIRRGIELNNKLIGYVDLASIKDFSAEFGIAIGESKLWGKGIGFRATKMMLEYAKTELGITIFHAETHNQNFRSRKMLEKIGFKEISRIDFEKYMGTECCLIQYRYLYK
jgi:[ribosomal protein S5]-alanine N-acetyltransferase